MKLKQRGFSQRGFTLIEVMLALAVSGGLLLTWSLVRDKEWSFIWGDIEAARYKEHKAAVSRYMSRYYGNLVQNTLISGVLTPAFQSPMCDPSGRNNAHATAYNDAALNRDDGRRACLIPPASVTGLPPCNNGEDGCFTVLPACDPSLSNKPCVTDHLRSYPLNPSIADLQALLELDESFPTPLDGNGATLVTAIYKEGVGPDAYNLRAMIAQDRPFLKFSGDPDLAKLGEVVGKIGPDGGMTNPEYGSGESRTPSFTAAAGQNTYVSATQQYVLGGIDYATLAPTMSADDPARQMIQSARAGLEADKAAGRSQWLGLSGYPNGAVLVMRAGFGSADMDQYVTRDGTKPFTGNVNLGGNRLKNLGLVDLDRPCDGSNAASAASKAMNGQIATVTPRVADPNKPTEKLGAGYIVICGYDQFHQGYIWKKATAGVSTIEDGKAGMFEGIETNYEWSCNAETTTTAPATGLAIPATSMTLGRIIILKFVIKNGAAWSYIQQDFFDVTKGWVLFGGPYPLDTRWDWVNYGVFPVLDYDIMRGPQDAWGFQCRWGWGHWDPTGTYAGPKGTPGTDFRPNPNDKYFGVFAQWTFGASAIVFSVQGGISRENSVYAYNPSDPVNSTNNHKQDDLSQIPVTTAGNVTAFAGGTCNVTVNPATGIGTANCPGTNIPVNTTGNTTARTKPVQTFTPQKANLNVVFTFQDKSHCVRVGGVPSGAPIAWGLPPASRCDW